MKKNIVLLALLTLTSLSTFAPAQAEGQNSYTNLNSFCNFMGAFDGIFNSRGDFDPENKQLFEEVARSLNVDRRKIKLKNSGILIRFFLGYHKAISSQALHRIYINQDWFNELPTDQKRFLLTQMLLHHRNEHGFIDFAVDWLPLRILYGILQSTIAPGNNPIRRYLTTLPGLRAYPRLIPVFDSEDIVNRQLVGVRAGMVVNNSPFASYNIYTLLMAQLRQHLQRRLDHDAVTLAELDPEIGVELMKSIYKPNTKEWPWYGKLQMGIYRTLIEPIKKLPIIKQHENTIVSYEDRVAYLRSLKDKWLETQDQYNIPA